MQMNHDEYTELKDQLESDFNSVFKRIDDCDKVVRREENEIENVKKSIVDLKIEQTKTNTRLGILIGILATIAVPILALCIKLLFGT